MLERSRNYNKPDPELLQQHGYSNYFRPGQSSTKISMRRFRHNVLASHKGHLASNYTNLIEPHVLALQKQQLYNTTLFPHCWGPGYCCLDIVKPEQSTSTALHQLSMRLSLGNYSTGEVILGSAMNTDRFRGTTTLGLTLRGKGHPQKQ